MIVTNVIYMKHIPKTESCLKSAHEMPKKRKKKRKGNHLVLVEDFLEDVFLDFVDRWNSGHS